MEERAEHSRDYLLLACLPFSEYWHQQSEWVGNEWGLPVFFVNPFLFCVGMLNIIFTLIIEAPYIYLMFSKKKPVSLVVCMHIKGRECGWL